MHPFYKLRIYGRKSKSRNWRKYGRSQKREDEGNWWGEEDEGETTEGIRYGKPFSFLELKSLKNNFIFLFDSAFIRRTIIIFAQIKFNERYEYWKNQSRENKGEQV